MQEAKEIVVENQKSVEKITLQKIHFVLYSFLKRILDIVLSLIALVFVIPICLIIKAVTLHYEDYDSIFYTQERIGKNGKKILANNTEKMFPKFEETVILMYFVIFA